MNFCYIYTQWFKRTPDYSVVTDSATIYTRYNNLIVNIKQSVMKKLTLLLLTPALLFLALTSCGDVVDEADITGGEEKDLLEISDVKLTFTKEGGEKQVEITSNQAWQIEIEDTEWLTASVQTGENDATVKFEAVAYNDIEDRFNLITIKSATLTRQIIVTQLADDPMLDVDKTELSCNYEGRTEVLKITSNTDWEIVIDEDDSWITADVYEGNGDMEVTLTIPEYYGKTNRDATVTVKCEGIEKEIEVSQTFPKAVGVWIMSEGSATKATADLAYYDFVKDELKTKYYSEVHGEPLGCVANYIVKYGSKMYVAVAGPIDGSDGKIQVLDYKSGELLNTIPIKNSYAGGDLPRQIAVHDGKLYVTSYFSGYRGEPIGKDDDPLDYGGVVKIDTATLSVEGSIWVGNKPEGIAYHDNKLYVCINKTGDGKTMQVIDVPSFTVTETINVPQNPSYIKVASNGDIYFSTMEVWRSISDTDPSALHQLYPDTYQVRTFAGARAGRFAITDKYIYTGDFSYSTYVDSANKINRQTGEVTPIDLDHFYFMIYSFDVNPVTGDIYIGGQGQDVIFMDEAGTKLKSFKVGVGFVNQFIPVFE